MLANYALFFPAGTTPTERWYNPVWYSLSFVNQTDQLHSLLNERALKPEMGP